MEPWTFQILILYLFVSFNSILYKQNECTLKINKKIPLEDGTQSHKGCVHLCLYVSTVVCGAVCMYV